MEQPRGSALSDIRRGWILNRFHDLSQWVLIIVVSSIWITHTRLNAEESRLDWDSVETIAEGVRRGRFVGWTEAGDGAWFEDQAGTAWQVPLRQIVRYGKGSLSRSGEGLLLVDGSRLMGRVRGFDAQAVELLSEVWRIRVPRALVRGVMVAAPALGHMQNRFVAAAFAAEGAEDQVLLVNGDRISGTIVSDGVDAKGPGGLWRRGDPVGIRRDGALQQVAWSEIRGIVFSPLLSAVVAPVGQGSWVGMADGSALRIEAGGGDRRGLRQFKLVCGLTIQCVGNPANESVVYLSGGELADESQRLNLVPPVRLRQVGWFEEPIVAEATRELVGWQGYWQHIGIRRDHPLPGREAAVQQSEWDWTAHAIESAVNRQLVYRLEPGANGRRPERFRCELRCTSFQFGEIEAYVRIVRGANRIDTVWQGTLRSLDAGGKLSFAEQLDIRWEGGAALILETARGPEFRSERQAWRTSWGGWADLEERNQETVLWCDPLLLP